MPTVAEPDYKGIVRRIYEEVFNGKQYQLISQFYHTDFEAIDPGYFSRIHGQSDLEQLIRKQTVAFPDMRYRVEDMVGDGDRVAVRWSAAGTNTGDLDNQPATHKPIAVEGIAIIHFVEGKVARVWQHWDNLGLMVQTGSEFNMKRLH